MTATRLNRGGLVDHAKAVSFYWNGKAYQALSGDTLASALLANNIWVVSRSFKYHRPRGVMSCGVEEAGGIVSIGEGAYRDVNVKATMQELYSGLRAYGQNAWPSVNFDLARINDFLSPFFAAGFYYKTFMGIPPLEWGSGTGVWMQYEKLIRRSAGMGRAPRLPDPDAYEHAHGYCDVLVVGSGPAGLHAASSASDAGLDVWLVEQDSEFGGDYLSQNEHSEIEKLTTQLKTKGVTLLERTTAFGMYDNNVVALNQRVTDHVAQPSHYLPRQRLWTVRARHIILATGAIERSLVYSNNDLPGCMSASAALRYLNRFAVRVGQKIVIATTNDSAYPVARQLSDAGASVVLLDVRRTLDDPTLHDQTKAAGVQIHLKTAPYNAVGRKRVKQLTTAVQAGKEWRAQSTLDADCVLVSGGWSPVVHLMSQRGVKPKWHKPSQSFQMPPNALSSITLVGSAAGEVHLSDCVKSGYEAGVQVMHQLGAKPATVSVPEFDDSANVSNKPADVFEVVNPAAKAKSFVDFEHDVTSADVRLALQEGFVSVEHLKRYTTLGMATDQGKMGNVNGIAVMADTLGCAIDDVGTTTFRPPYTPVSLGALRGPHVQEHFKPARQTPLHKWNLAHGAVMIEAGLWLRPWYFPFAGESLSEASVREASCVREAVGLCDVSTLGKIQIQGPDAAEFLNRVYTNDFHTLETGRVRYGVMLRDDGMVMDDGTTWRIGEHDYFMTTTTAHASMVMSWLEELLQGRWPELRVVVTSVTDQWAGVSIAGPRSRDVLVEQVADTHKSSLQQLKFMGVLDVNLINGLTCRIARISFSGELAYEIYTHSGYADAMMDTLWQGVKQAGGCLYGLEALGTLATEKGHVTGAELDGRVTLDDAGLGSMASKQKPYIGQVLSKRPLLQEKDRPRLVGIFPVDSDQRFNAGSLLFAADKVYGHGEGWVTRVTFSPALGHWLGVGFISGGYSAWEGKSVICADPLRESSVEVRLVSPHMFDPKGDRQRA